MAEKPVVGIMMGSQSDWPTMQKTAQILDELGIPNEAKVISAHRTPDRMQKYTSTARERGLKVIIAGAGKAAALPGAVAALTPLRVLGVPMKTSDLGGQDSLLSMVQMPAGIPVGTLAIGNAGATNAGLLAAANARGLTTLGVKPIAAGCHRTDEGLRNDDALLLQQTMSLSLSYEQVNPVALEPAIAPHIAAAQAGKRLLVSQLSGYCRGVLMQKADVAVVEGAGGWRLGSS